MKCPNCGSEYGEDLRITGRSQKRAYRCSTCGCLYLQDTIDLTDVVESLHAMKARVEQMAQEHHMMLENIAELETRLNAANDQVGPTTRSPARFATA